MPWKESGARNLSAQRAARKSQERGKSFSSERSRRQIYLSPLFPPLTSHRLTVGSFSSPFHSDVGRFTANNDAFNDQRRRYRDDSLTSAMQSRETATFATRSRSSTPIITPNFLGETAVIPFLVYVCFR